MMDRMGMDQDSVMIIHMGGKNIMFLQIYALLLTPVCSGTFNDKAATLERFKENYRTLLSDGIKRRLVLENDEVRPLANVPRSTETHSQICRSATISMT